MQPQLKRNALFSITQLGLEKVTDKQLQSSTQIKKAAQHQC